MFFCSILLTKPSRDEADRTHLVFFCDVVFLEAIIVLAIYHLILVEKRLLYVARPVRYDRGLLPPQTARRFGRLAGG